MGGIGGGFLNRGFQFIAAAFVSGGSFDCIP
jgi:hypothetical protein